MNPYSIKYSSGCCIIQHSKIIDSWIQDYKTKTRIEKIGFDKIVSRSCLNSVKKIGFLTIISVVTDHTGLVFT